MTELHAMNNTAWTVKTRGEEDWGHTRIGICRLAALDWSMRAFCGVWWNWQ